MEKGIFVKDIKPGLKITGVFTILNPALCPSVRGPFWKFMLADATGSIPGKIWYPKSVEFTDLPMKAYVEASGGASLYSGQLQITVECLVILENNSQIDQSWFLPVSQTSPEEMFAQLRALCLTELKYKPWRKFALSVLDDKKIAEALKNAPAAKSIHQAWLGGLLEHLLNVSKLALSIADNYPELDRQLLLAAAMFHDIGKIAEYSWDFNFETTDSGELLGHLLLGLEILNPKLAASGLEQELIDHFKHLILSHHGEYAYGSPRLPQTAEAFALHFADNLDARLAQCKQAEPVEGTRWTEKQWSLGRKIFKPQQTPGQQKQKSNQDQECLFLLKE